LRRHTEGGRNLGGIEHSEPAAGSCTDIEPATTTTQAADEYIDRLRDARDLATDRLPSLTVLAVNQTERVAYTELIEIARRLEDFLGH
jgi:hypothetical protein